MRRYFLFAFICLFSIAANAQNFDEWVRQRRTQVRYLLKQIAGLQIYIDLAREGYTTVNDGLHFISDIRQGELSLHSDHFASRSSINPSIKILFQHYSGPCRGEVDLLLTDNYYQLTDDERLNRLRTAILHCK